jgi:uncharacterized protein (DUF58 family)
VTTAAWTPLRAGRPRLSRRAVLQLGLGVLLYLAGANAAAGWVVVLAAAVLGVVPWAWASAWRAGRSIEVRRHTPARAVAGEAVRTVLEVRAASGAHAVVHDHLTGASGAAGGLRDGAELHADVPLRRGAVRGGQVEVTVTDLFGLVGVLASGEVPACCDVLPAVPALPAGTWLADWAVQAQGASLRTGHGTEVLGVREYRAGDPPKVIHWRTTARHGRLIARELATEARPRLRVEVGPGVWDQEALDRAAEAGGALAGSAQAVGHTVELAMDGVSVGWGIVARHHLALLPPHVGAAARALAPPPPGQADITVTLTPADGGVAVQMSTGSGVRDLGVLPADLDAEGVSAWLAVRTRRSAV